MIPSSLGSAVEGREKLQDNGKDSFVVNNFDMAALDRISICVVIKG
jgi:hypothetical protein